MDFEGFVGPAYSAANSLQDNQLSINYFPERSTDPNSKTPQALLSVPGLIKQFDGGIVGQVRALYALSGSYAASSLGSAKQCIAVIDTRVFLVTFSQPYPNQRPTFTPHLIGTLNSNLGSVSVRDNGAGGTVVIVDGTNMYVYNRNTNVFTTSSDPAFLGSNLVCEIDGFFMFAKPHSQTFYTSPVYWDGVSPFDGTFFALKDNYNDQIVGIIEANRQLWIFGEETTEIWYMQGGTYFPLGRLQGSMQQFGCAAPFSIARSKGGPVWLGRSERGNNHVFAAVGYETVELTNPAIAYQINQYATVSDAIGYIYEEEGHEFYVLTFPSADITWAFDLQTKEWHQRASFDTLTGQFHRHQSNCAVNFQNLVLVGDYKSGNVYWQTRTVFSNDVDPLVGVRQSPHIWDKNDRNRIRYNRLQIEFKPGSTPINTNPQAILAWSNDGGQTWSNDHYASIGLTGQTKNRVMWRRLGVARDRLYRVTVSDPVYRDITGASFQGVGYKS